MILNLDTMPHGESTVDRKTAAAILGISQRQFRREVLAHAIKPVCREKRNLLFAASDIESLKKYRFTSLMATRGYIAQPKRRATKRVVTVNQAKRKAAARKGRR